MRSACALALVGLSGGAVTQTVPAAPSATAPTVTINVPVTDWSTQQPLRAQIDVSGTATPSTGRIITSVAFEFAPAGTGRWSAPQDPTQVQPDGTYDQPSLDTGGRTGRYDIRAVATDDLNETGTAVAPDRVIANNATFVALRGTGTPLRGTVTLTATPEQGAATPDTVTVWRAPTGTQSAPGTQAWTKVADLTAEVDSNGDPTGNFVGTFDSSTLDDGSYDLSVTASSATKLNGAYPVFVANVVRAVVVDNTSPEATLQSPGSSLSGVVTLSASAQDAGTGVSSVRFESSPAGSDVWTTIGEANSAPYTTSFDTRQLPNGNYDFRVQATDHAGNTGVSPVVPGIAVSNGSVAPVGNFGITTYVAPATQISLLGEITGSPENETWAYGYTNAPPPNVDGAPLPYTRQGNNQLVLLRYTDATGWQIADVLRNADGSAYQQPAGSPSVTGAMTDAGEAWIVVNGSVFHRVPGGRFLFDQAASSALAPLGSGSGHQIKLGRSADGTTYGVELATSQPSVFVPQASGNPSKTELKYGVLRDGAWSVVSASLPPGYAIASDEEVKLTGLDPTGVGTGWGVLSTSAAGVPLMLASFDSNGWHFVTTGLDALDLTDQFQPGSQPTPSPGNTLPLVTVTPSAITTGGNIVHADSGGVWVAAQVSEGGVNPGKVVARYDTAQGRVVESWCEGLPRESHGCGRPLDLDHPAAVPDSVSSTADGPVAEAWAGNFIDVYAHGTWTSVAAPGFAYVSGPTQGLSLFVDPQTGWVVGPNSLGRVSANPPPPRLAVWPQPNRSPLLSVALPPGASSTDTAGALAVGLDGTALHYDPSAGWQVDATPPQTHHIGLYGVAFNGPASAFAVGVGGTILHWDGSAWSADPQSFSVTTATLNAVAFGTDGQGWAVGVFGTILHYDGTAWSEDQLDPQLGGANITSVTVAGKDVFAIANGNLIERGADGVWRQVPSSELPSPAPAAGSLQLVSGLPEGGLAVAGRSVLMLRQSATSHLTYAAQSFQGTAVGLAAFRDPGGDVRAFVSAAPPVVRLDGTTAPLGGFPAGDGDLMLETDSGFQDLSRSQFPSENSAVSGDGVVHPDPVLAVASSSDGSHAWAVGGYAGTHAADGVGLDSILPTRPFGWRTSTVWRYDAGKSVESPAVTATPVSLPAQSGTVSFAFFSSPLCARQCAAVARAQPDVNLSAAANQIAAFAQQPGGPAFAMLGGNARGPIDTQEYQQGGGAIDMRRLPNLLSPLVGVPTYAAFGPLDAVPTEADPALPWAQAFTNAPAPFGPGPAPGGISSAGAGDSTARVHKYYAFDVQQNGGTLRVIVLDNSAGSLEQSASGQTAWLSDRLAEAQGVGRPVVVVAARPLNTADDGAASDGDAVAQQLTDAGVLGVFTTSGGSTDTWANQRDQVAEIPFNAAPGAPQIPEYEGATLTYQQPRNNGVLWYEASVDTVGRTLTVQGIPVTTGLALEPLNGLTATRSSTLSFQAIARRPLGTVATSSLNPGFPGYDSYVGIPSSTCGTCIGPSYTFASSDPVVGDFVVPSAPGSPYPKLNAKGKTTPSSTSGLFCAYNSGTTTVSVTTGLLTSSLPVTVRAGGFGPPCGTVPGGVNTNVITIPGRSIIVAGENPGAGAPTLGQPSSSPGVLPKISIPPLVAAVPPVPTPAVPLPAPKPKPPPAKQPPSQPTPFVSSPVPNASALAGYPPVALPLVPPAITPVPPGGATATAQSTAKREEKARKHASQSAYVTRPAGTSATDWFYPAVITVGVLALLLVAGGTRPGPRPKPALAALWDPGDPRARRR